MRLPSLSPTAKGQLWGMCVGGATAFYAAYKLDYGLGLFFVGWGAAWLIGERLFGARLIGVSDVRSVALAITSGLAFPWVGFLVTALFQLVRP